MEGPTQGGIFEMMLMMMMMTMGMMMMMMMTTIIVIPIITGNNIKILFNVPGSHMLDSTVRFLQQADSGTL